MDESVKKPCGGLDQEVSRAEPGQDEVRAALEQVLASQPFRTSRQCQNLLRYIVDHSLRGEELTLRERVVGVEVFGRSADYDTAEDPVVRMRAADVRKRLAQFYQSIEVQRVLIELRPGSYRASFRYVEKFGPGVPALPSAKADAFTALHAPGGSALDATNRNDAVIPRKRGWRRLAGWTVLTSILLLLGSGFVGARWWSRRLVPQQLFWAPLTQGKQPVLLYLGANVAYRFTPGYMSRYQQQHDLKQNGPEFFPVLPAGTTIRSEDLQPAKSTFVTVGDVAASVQVVSLLNSWSRPFVLRSAEDVTMGDLRNTPAVFIGGFNNRWSLLATDSLPLVFRSGTSIVEQAHPEHQWTIDPNVHTETMQDYALISRVMHGTTGGPVLEVGGIGSFGTQAAAEFVCSPERMNDLLRSAPAGWESKNVQIVLHIQVVNYTPIAVDVVSTRFW